MKIETCKDCEIRFADALSVSKWLDNMLEWNLDNLHIDNKICLKCLVRILKRFID